MSDRAAPPIYRQEAVLSLALATALFFAAIGSGNVLAHAESWRGAAMFAWLFVVIVVGSAAVARHAERLAELLGEPYGTLILTFSVTSIEILTIAIVMTTGDPNPTLARDTMFSVVMIVLNGLIGLALLLGGLRYREQSYNLQGVNAYLSVIVALAVFGLVVPNLTVSTPGATFSPGQEGFLIAMCIALYGVFVAIQTTRHRGYFMHPEDGPAVAEAASEPPQASTLAVHCALLLAYLALVIFLAHKLAILLDHGLDTMRAPPALGALVVAILVLAPEGLAGIRAALANRIQRSANILLGSALATLALTIPAVVAIGLVHGNPVVLGLDPVEQAMLLLTLLVSMLTFASGRTNVLQGAVHMMLFAAYLMLIIWH